MGSIGYLMRPTIFESKCSLEKFINVKMAK